MTFCILKKYLPGMTLKQNASLDRKDTDMLTVFKPLLNEHLNLARIRLLYLFIN